MKVVVIGGGAAGVTAAAEIRKHSQQAEITIIEKSQHYPYSPCSLPYVISGEIESFDKITTFNSKFFSNNKINFQINSKVSEINPEAKTVTYTNENQTQTIDYDYLVLATGGKSITPSIKGIDQAKHFSLKTIDDAKKIIQRAAELEEGNALIIGGGMVGVELANALNKKNIKTTIIEATDYLLAQVLDPRMSRIVEGHLLQLGIKVYKSTKIEEITSDEVISNNQQLKYNMLVVVCGIAPNTKLAKSIGLETNKGISVSKQMQTSNPHIFACGDCVKISNCAHLATNTILQAKIAAQNITGEKPEFPAVLNTMVTKAGAYIIASTGATETALTKQGTNTVSATYSGETRAEYYPQKEKIFVKLISDHNAVLLGAQIIGGEDIVGRINWLALAIQKKMTVQELCAAETAYNPATSSLFDPVIVAAQMLQTKISRRND